MMKNTHHSGKISGLPLLLTSALLGFASLALTGCGSSEEQKEEITEEVLEVRDPKPFTKSMYEQMIVQISNGQNIETNTFHTLGGIVTDIQANQSDSSTTMELEIKPWEDSTAEASFLFAASQTDFVLAKKPGDSVDLKQSWSVSEWGKLTSKELSISANS